MKFLPTLITLMCSFTILPGCTVDKPNHISTDTNTVKETTTPTQNTIKEIEATIEKQGEYITEASAVSVATTSPLFERIYTQEPNFANLTDIYVSDIKKLKDFPLTFKLTPSTEKKYNAALNESAIQVLLSCNNKDQLECITYYNRFMTVPNYKDGNPYLDMVFVINAKTGEIIVRERTDADHENKEEMAKVWKPFTPQT